MKFSILVLVLLTRASAFSSTRHSQLLHSTGTLTSTVLAVSSVGLGPTNNSQEDKVWVEGIDYTIPNHEEYRLSRRSKIDEQADAWFEKLLGNEVGMLDQLATDMKERLLKQVELVNDVSFLKFWHDTLFDRFHGLSYTHVDMHHYHHQQQHNQQSSCSPKWLWTTKTTLLM